MSKTSKRLLNKCIDLQKESLLQFFDSRGSKFDEQNPYVSILYQDHHKELAARRDLYEKNKITPLLHLNGKQRLLDIGCGVGRWADSTLYYLNSYLGLDFSSCLIDLAIKRFKGQEKARFIVMDAKNVSGNTLGEYGLFDRIIISGVLLYLNDAEVEQALKGVAELCAKDCLIYIREPLAYKERLTLNEYWSSELNSAYSAIYRTIDEMNGLLENIFGKLGFNVKAFENLYEDQSMNNRSETGQFFTILSNASKGNS